MAKVIKNEKVNTQIEEIVEDVHEPDNEVNAVAVDNDTELDLYKNRVEKLEKTLSDLQSLLVNLNRVQNVTSVPMQRDEVTIICNFSGKLQVNFPTWQLSMSKFGQKVVITRQQFQELVNSHRKYFEREYILLDAKHIDLAEQLQVPMFDPKSGKYMKYEDLEKIGEMNALQLREYYEKLSEPVQRIFLSWYMEKCYNKDDGFYNVEKMTVLNGATKGNLFDMLIASCVSDGKQN